MSIRIEETCALKIRVRSKKTSAQKHFKKMECRRLRVLNMVHFWLNKQRV